MKYFFSFFLLLTIFSVSSYSQNHVAKVTFLKGKVFKNTKIKQGFTLKVGDKLNEGDFVQTKQRSIAKLVFQDGTKLVIGPVGTVHISKFNKKEAGIITLMQGQVRSVVNKAIDSDSKSKYFIKTANAAMGVRGTDFQVKFNASINKSEVFVREGLVKMANLESIDNPLNQKSLDSELNSGLSEDLEQGMYSYCLKDLPPVKPQAIKLKPLDIGETLNTLPKVSIKKMFEEDPVMRASIGATENGNKSASISRKNGEADVEKYLKRIKRFNLFYKSSLSEKLNQ